MAASRHGQVVAVTIAARTRAAVLWNSAALLATRTISLVRFVVLAAVLHPDDLGVLAIAWAALELLLVVTNPGMGTALIQRRSVEERDYDTVWTAGLLRTAAVGVCLVLVAGPVATAFGEPRATPFLRALAFAPFITAAASPKLAALERALTYGRLTTVRVVEALTEAVVSVALVLALGVWALVVGVVVAAVVRLVLSYAVAPHRPRLLIHPESVRSLLRFGRWMFLVGVTGVAGEAMLRLAVSHALGTAQLGLFFFAVRVVTMPVLAVEGAVDSVGMRAHVAVGDDVARRARGLQTSLVTLLAVLGPAYAVLLVLADRVAQALGPQWSAATGSMRVLAPAALLSVVAIACGPLLLALDRPQVIAGLTAGRAALLCACGGLLAVPWGVAGAAGGYLIAELVNASASLALTLPLVAHGMQGLRTQLCCVACGTAAAAAAAVAVAWRVEGAPALLLAGLAGAGAALVVLVAMDRHLDAGATDGLRLLLPRLPAARPG